MASSTCNKSFSSNYMLLKPEEASSWEVTKLLFSSNIGKRKFVDCPEGTRESFAFRWIIFVSIIAQKVLQAFAKPLAFLGAVTEFCLNLVSLNGGFFSLLLNIITVNVAYPDSTSANFSSMIGLVDTRTELDSSITTDDIRYYPALSIMASKLSYENNKHIQKVVNDHWKMELLGAFDFWNDYQEKATTQAFIMDDKKDTIVVAFRGTEPFDADAWSTDLDMSWYKLPGMGKMHGGFMKALGLQKSVGWPPEQAHEKTETAYYVIRRILKEHLIKNKNGKFIVTGHSLGGALAVLFPAILGLHEETFLLERLVGVYTFGQPRVGDRKFANYMQKLMEYHDFNIIRFVYSYDVVPRIPYDDSDLMFTHFGICVFYNSFYQGRVVPEEPNKNYFSLIWLIPKTINAWWELFRSFFIKYRRGKEYEEGLVLKFMRVVGILVAGVPAHCPQDYVNATRLGPLHVFSSIKSSSKMQ
ncbi:hypothetical protein ACS0TY_006142 [Phlomoides rotata]